MPNRYRFWANQLRAGVYDRCVIPTKEGPVPAGAHAVPEAQYTRHDVSRTALRTFKHVEFAAPPTAPAPPAQLARPFRHFELPRVYYGDNDVNAGGGDDDAGGGVGSKRKRGGASTKAKPKPKKKMQTNGQKRRDGLDAHFRSVKVEIVPTRAQFNEFMATFRVAINVYNWANGAVKHGGVGANHFGLRAHFREVRPVDMMSTANGAPPTLVASRVVSYAIKELAENYGKHSDKPYRVHDRYFFATERVSSATFTVEKSFGRAPGVRFGPVCPVRNHHGDTERPARGRAECSMFLGNNFERVGGIRIRDSADVIARISAEGNRLKENAKIMWNKRTDKLYLIYTYTVPKLADPDPDFADKRIVATDPGCTPFQAFYSPTTGGYGELLSGMREPLRQRCLAIDVLQTRIARHRGRITTSFDRMDLPPAKRALRRQATRRRLRKRLRREHQRLHNWMENAHYDAANFLLERYDVVIQPVLATRRLTQHAQARFGHGLARRLYNWSHYLFRQRLKSASARYAGRHVLESTEPGTSKTCTQCGFWNANLRLGDKTFRCPHCSLCVDRQTAGARNNFLAAYGIAVKIGWDGVVVGG